MCNVDRGVHRRAARRAFTGGLSKSCLVGTQITRLYLFVRARSRQVCAVSLCCWRVVCSVVGSLLVWPRRQLALSRGRGTERRKPSHAGSA